MIEPFLIGDAMTGGYGGADILHSCTISVEKGEIAVIVGPNGAGKSTAMKAVFGMLPLREGAVRLGGKDITDLKPQDRVPEGMAFVPQTQNVFTGMTVKENLEMGAYLRDSGVEETMDRSSASSRFWPKSRTKWRVSCRAASASRWPSAAR